jgi:hypothetical protein
VTPTARQPTVSAKADRWTLIQQTVATLAALGTLAAILLTWISLQQVDNDQALTREGQVTDRYNNAVGNIGNEALEVRLGGLYALQRIMEDSPRDQPSIVDVLSTYIRNQAKEPEQGTSPSIEEPTSDVRVALTALGWRNRHHDGTARVDLSGAYLVGVDLSGADLSGANLTDANLSAADLSGADLTGANLYDAALTDANLNVAKLLGAHLAQATLVDVELNGAALNGANLAHAALVGAELNGADLTDANLTYADLTNADLTNTDLNLANVTGVKR